jgi:hypothetical protein
MLSILVWAATACRVAGAGVRNNYPNVYGDMRQRLCRENWIVATRRAVRTNTREVRRVRQIKTALASLRTPFKPAVAAPATRTPRSSSAA